MRLLGTCPNCGNEDSIFTHEHEGSAGWSNASCTSCSTFWEDWEVLREEQGKIGKLLIPILVEETPMQVTLQYPEPHYFPFAHQVVRILNTALMVRFHLTPAFGVEGGVEGLLQKERRKRAISLEVTADHIGLYDEFWEGDWGEPNPVLTWYRTLLRILLEDRLVVGGIDYGRGAILKLSPLDPEVEAKTRVILFLALVRKTRRKKFARTVFDRARADCESGAGSFSVGLKVDEIKRRFIQPP